jgi:hypothetical protein
MEGENPKSGMVMFHQEQYGLQWKKNDFDVLGNYNIPRFLIPLP